MEHISIEFTQEDVQRFERFLNKQPSSCWIFCGCISTLGYGAFSVASKMIRAHRFAYTCYIGPIPTGSLVLHKCDNPTCCNPHHLELGNQHKNMQDCADRGRHGIYDQSGIKGPNVKLTSDQVKEIKFLLISGLLSQRELATKFHVSQAEISHIETGKVWQL